MYVVADKGVPMVSHVSFYLWNLGSGPAGSKSGGRRLGMAKRFQGGECSSDCWRLSMNAGQTDRRLFIYYLLDDSNHPPPHPIDMIRSHPI